MTLYKLKQVFGDKDTIVYFYKDDKIVVKNLSKLYYRNYGKDNRVICVKVNRLFYSALGKIGSNRRYYYPKDLTQKEKDLCGIVEYTLGNTHTPNFVTPTLVDDDNIRGLGLVNAIEVSCEYDFNI